MVPASDNAHPWPRRQILAVVLTGAGGSFSGCFTEDDPADEDLTETSTVETETSEPTDYGMSTGTSLVEVSVEAEFDSDVIIDPECREDSTKVSPDQTSEIRRREDGEECSIQLVIDEEVQYDTFVYDYQSYTLTVKGNGEIEETVIAK